MVTGDNIGIASAGDHVRNIQGAQPLPSMAANASHSSGSAPEGEGSRRAQVRIEGANAGIASADDTTNIQETR